MAERLHYPQAETADIVDDLEALDTDLEEVEAVITRLDGVRSDIIRKKEALEMALAA